ncbi:MAG: zinc metalloprotease HtpX [bacterium]|nr:zinc metalloprotease HtpX [bacterium]
MNNILKTFVFLTALTILLIYTGSILGGPNGATYAFIFALLLNAGSYWFSDKIILSIYRAKKISKEDFPYLYNTVRELTTKSHLPLPQIYLIEDNTPNAFATGRDPQHAAIAVTSGILNTLNEEELKGVIAHELSHIKNRDILIGTIAATIAGAITMLASLARWAMIFGGTQKNDEDNNPFAFLIMTILAPVAALLIQMAISRSREYLADKSSAQMCENPLPLANALRKLHQKTIYQPMDAATPATAHLFIVNPLRGNSILNLFSTHPPIDARIKKLEALNNIN